jgi:hypothetical protein
MKVREFSQSQSGDFSFDAKFDCGNAYFRSERILDVALAFIIGIALAAVLFWGL